MSGVRSSKEGARNKRSFFKLFGKTFTFWGILISHLWLLLKVQALVCFFLFIQQWWVHNSTLLFLFVLYCHNVVIFVYLFLYIWHLLNVCLGRSMPSLLFLLRFFTTHAPVDHLLSSFHHIILKDRGSCVSYGLQSQICDFRQYKKTKTFDLTFPMLGLSCVCLSASHLSIRAGLLPTPVHCADSPVGSGQPQHRPSRQALRGIRGPQQRGVEQVPERLQGGY